MIKNLTCIECPQGCALSVDIENCRVVKVEGAKCPRGEQYAVSEIENPQRVLTSTVVVGNGLKPFPTLKMIPVRTDKPIPKEKLREVMAEIRKIIINKPVKMGEVIVSNLLGLNVNLIATRELGTDTIFRKNACEK